MSTETKITGWDIASGKAPAPETAVGRVIGAQNDYNARGNGSTMARRVYRGGQWQWLSAPASRGRYLSADRNDTVEGDVWGGDVIATFTLGGRGEPTPDKWQIVRHVPDSEGRITFRVNAARLAGGGYRLTVATRPGESIDVPNPSWR